MTIIFGQCNDPTRTKIALGTTYKTDCQDGSIISFLARLWTVCYGNDDGGLSIKPYKNVMTAKSLNNFSIVNPNDRHGFKEEFKTKHNSILAVVRKFQNRTDPIMELLKAEKRPFDRVAYCVIDVTEQAIWVERDHAPTKAMFLLLNSKNDNTKNNIRLNINKKKSAYPTTTKAMARYLSTQYPNKTISHQRN